MTAFYIVLVVLLFGVLVFVHELGHFITAKLSGVQVNEFSLFMGPALIKKQKGETLYALRCIPIGGYCAMEGEDGDSDNPRAFGNAKLWKRLIILVAGSFMNFVAGVLIAVLFVSIRFDVLPGTTFGTFAEGCPMSQKARFRSEIPSIPSTASASISAAIFPCCWRAVRRRCMTSWSSATGKRSN